MSLITKTQRVMVIYVLCRLFFSWEVVLSAEEERIEIIFVKSNTRSMEFTDHSTRIFLPLSFKKSLHKNFPNYKLPRSEDYKLDWAEFYEYHRVPFIAFGDFNHDGQQDIAALLVEEKRDNFWKLVIFHNNRDGYGPVLLASSPEQDKSSPQYGKDYGPIQRHGMTVKGKCSDGRSCLEFFLYESAGFEYIWKDGKYIEVNIGD